MNYFTPRPSQKKVLKYKSGRLGIAAVPGAGKTFTLSALAADLITRGKLESDQEVLIVTLVNSAVDNFAHRIGAFISAKNMLPNLGYRVRTLHGLAHDIVREKPSRVGLEERFAIVDEREADFIRREAVKAWLGANADLLDDYLDPALDESKRDWAKRDQFSDLADNLALAFIRSAKDRRLTPEVLRSRLDTVPAPLPLAEMGWAIYADYQRALAYRGAVDFDDLIRLSLDLLESDAEFLERLRYRFPYILEDEAQDSSILQEHILGLLAGPEGNWVRVGDPNQAIFETFTTASPELLRHFIAAHPHVDMAESGRSQPTIIGLANYLIEWVMNEHPLPEARAALAPPWIKPAPQDDPQPNPDDNPAALRFISTRYTPEAEIQAVAKSIENWLPEHSDWTVAVLVPRNLRGIEMIDALKKRGIETVEFLSSTSNTRAAAGALNYVLGFLADPQAAGKLSQAYRVWRRDVFRGEGKSAARKPYQDVADILRKLGNVEDFLAPTEERDWLSGYGESVVVVDPRRVTNAGEGDGASDAENVEFALNELRGFRTDVRRWLNAVTLPIDQLVLTLAQDIFTEPADLALAHKLALVLRKVADDHIEWRLPELTAELAVIARNERRFIGFSTDDSGFDPERHRGKVVVTTMHKAKGLEWDRVYLMSVNNYDFPSGLPNDRFIAEKWFIRSGLNLEAEALSQLEAALTTREYDWYEEGRASQDSRADYIRERLRLLYVGLTRAKRDLIVTWNTGRQGDALPAIAMQALAGWVEGQQISE